MAARPVRCPCWWLRCGVLLRVDAGPGLPRIEIRRKTTIVVVSLLLWGNGAGKLKQDYLQMKMLEVAPQVYAAAQLFESDLPLIAKQGARSVIITRPDGESADQPLSADLAKAADEYGITLVHFPVDPGSISKEDARGFAQASRFLPNPHPLAPWILKPIQIHSWVAQASSL